MAAAVEEGLAVYRIFVLIASAELLRPSTRRSAIRVGANLW